MTDLTPPTSAGGLAPASPEPAAAPLAPPVPAVPGALVVLAVIAVFAALHWAQAVFIPLVLGVLISYALNPLVSALARISIPRALGAALVLTLALGGIVLAAQGLRDDVSALLEQLPVAAKKLERSLRTQMNGGAFQKMQQTAQQLDKAAAAAIGAPTQGQAPARAEPRFDWRSVLWMGSVSAAAAIGQFSVVIFLVYFLLASGDLYKRKLVKIVGPSLTEKRITVQILDDINSQIERFLFVQLLSGAIVAVATWLGLRALGLENAGVWGIAAGVLNTLPYVGPVIVGGGTALVAFMQFGTLTMSLVVGGVTLLITSLEGLLLLPWLTSRTARMNAVAVFVGFVFWGWLWGPWGLFLAVPLMLIIKSVCDRVENLKPFGELLGS